MKRPILFGFSGVVGALLTGALLGAPAGCEDAPTYVDERVERGLAMSPVQIRVTDEDRDLVGLGSYIVNAQGACTDCHTCPTYAPGHNPFKGEEGQDNAVNFLAGGMAFGPIVSRDITPDEQGRPGGLTLEEFMNVMRTGEDPREAGRLLQVMPWPVYGRMSANDLRAIYAYLSAIPHAEPGTCGG
jgi:hypothetical protein